MSKSNNSYCKIDGEKERFPAREIPVAVSNSTSLEWNAKLHENYTKQDGQEDPSLLVVFSGGTDREDDYFSLIVKNRHIFKRVKIEFLAKSTMEIPNENPKLSIKKDEDGFSPDKLWLFAKHWVGERYTKNDGGNIELIDNIYLLSDVDHFVSELLRIKPLCENAGFKLIMSNSCFEKWLYYGHHADKPDSNPEVKFCCPDEHIKISSAFKTYLGSAIKGGADPRKAIFNLETAIANAKANYAEDENGIPQLYSTNMFELGEKLLELIEPELKKLENDEKERIEKYKKIIV